MTESNKLLFVPLGTDGHSGVFRGERIEMVRVWPAGGGSASSLIPAKDLEEISEGRYKEMLRVYQPEDVWGDWFDEGAPAIPAFINIYRHNNHLCPAFRKEDVDTAIADGRMNRVIYIEDIDAYAFVETEYGEQAPDHDYASEIRSRGAEISDFELQVGDDLVGVSVFRGRDIETTEGTVHVYDIGWGSWTWGTAPEPSPEAAPRF